MWNLITACQSLPLIAALHTEAITLYQNNPVDVMTFICGEVITFRLQAMNVSQTMSPACTSVTPQGSVCL